MPTTVARVAYPEQTPEESSGADLQRALGVLRKSLAWLVLVPLIAGVVAFALSSQQTEYFTASAEVRVRNANSEVIFGNQQSAGDPRREIETQIRIIKSANFRTMLADLLGAENRLIKSVEVAAVGETDVIEMSVTSRSATLSAKAANLLADIYVASRKSTAESALRNQADEIRKKADDLNKQVESLNGKIGDARARLADNPAVQSEVDQLSAERLALLDQLNSFRLKAVELDVEADARSGAVEIVNKATPPSKPSEPKPLQSAVLVAMLALLTTAVAAFILDRLNDTIDSAEDLTEASGGLPILGRLPELGKGKPNRHVGSGPDTGIAPKGSPDSEAFRRLRSAIWFLALRDEAHSIVITSPNPGEGKSRIAANLAISLASSGARVVLISADLRKPTLGTYFGIDESKNGLTTVLMGDSRLSKSLIDVPGMSTLKFLPTGAEGFDPGVLLGSPAMGELIQQLRAEGADILIIDTAPLGPVSDAVDLAQHVDGFVVVARADSTRGRQLSSAVDSLRNIEARVLGCVLNADPVLGKRRRYGYGKNYGYGYGYGDGYGSATAEPTAEQRAALARTSGRFAKNDEPPADPSKA